MSKYRHSAIAAEDDPGSKTAAVVLLRIIVYATILVAIGGAGFWVHSSKIDNWVMYGGWAVFAIMLLIGGGDDDLPDNGFGFITEASMAALVAALVWAFPVGDWLLS